MPEQIDAISTTVEATYKAREVEGIVDLYFYRKIGFWLAQRFAERNVRPATVSLLGGVVGIVAGHLYYYPLLAVNILGVGLHIIANALDNADGQLARLTNQQSRSGRILDGVVDHIVWLGVYVHLALRHVAGGGSSWIWFLALAAGLSHAAQAAVADYSRNAYLYFGRGRSGVDFDSASSLQKNYRELPWRGRILEKILFIIYANSTRQQEMLLPGLTRLQETVARDFPREMPAWLQSRYRTTARPVLKWCGWLMTNARMFLLFFLFLIAKPTWFFWVELTLFNGLLGYVIFQQQEISESVLELIEHPPPA
jgi:phosphatidylglycerophosphate synthase